MRMIKNILTLLILPVLSCSLSAQSAETRARLQGQPPVLRPPLYLQRPAPAASETEQPYFIRELEKKRRAAASAASSPETPPPPAPPAVIPFEPSLALSAEWSSRYMKYGWCRNDRPVGILQAEFSESVGYVGVRGVYDFTDTVNRQWQFQEAWFYAGASADFVNAGEWGPVTVELSWTHNTMPGNSGENHGEIGLGFYLNQMYVSEQCRLSSGLQIDYDYDRSAANIRFNLAWEQCLNREGTLFWRSDAALYWGDTSKIYLLTEKCRREHGFYATVWRTALEWHFREGWRLSPEISFAYVPERPLRQAAGESAWHHPSTLWGGIRIVRIF